MRLTPARLLAGSLAAAALGAWLPTLSRAELDVTWRETRVALLLKDGRTVTGTPTPDRLTLEVDGQPRALRLRDVLSVHLAAPAAPPEASRIAAGLAAVQGTDRRAREVAMTELTDLGLPVLSPLLAAYKDTDAHEPNPLYHLFSRIVPGYADRLDRSLDLVRLASGEALRGKLAAAELKIKGADGQTQTVSTGDLRRLAVGRPAIDRTFDVQALRHCTQIEFLDTGVALSDDSRVTADAQGFVRLSFDIDGWSSDPDGLKVPGPNYKTNLVDGFPFGALVGRVGPTGPRWLAGRHVEKRDAGPGRLYLAVNDNGHWQNNIGSFRVRLRVTNAYDLGDSQ